MNIQPGVKEKRIGYAPTSSILQILEWHRDGKLDLPLTARQLRTLNMPKWNIFSVQSTLRDLTLFHDGRPTDVFDQLARAYRTDQEKYQEILRSFLKSVYGEVFAYISHAHIDLEVAKSTQIEKAFAEYEPQKQHRNMAYLFLGLCREAGLLSDGNLALQDQETIRQPDRAETFSELVEVKGMNEVPQVTANGHTGLHPNPTISRIEKQRNFIQQLLSELPDVEWPEEQRDWWGKTLKSNVELLVALFERKGQEMK